MKLRNLEEYRIRKKEREALESNYWDLVCKLEFVGILLGLLNGTLKGSNKEMKK